MLEYLGKAGPLSLTMVLENQLKKDHRIASLGGFDVLKCMLFDILTVPRKVVSICEHNGL